jgi:hypothetical protein
MRMTPAFELEHVTWLDHPASELAYGAGHVWASVPDDDGVTKIDPRTKNTITNHVGPRPEQLVVSHDRVFVASNTGHKVVVLSTRTGLPVGESLPVPPNPYGLGAGEGHVWVTGTGRSTLTRIDF